MNKEELKRKMDEMVLRYNQSGFITDDPVCIPHQFSKKQDKEIAGLFAAIIAWGQRKTIIQNANRLMKLMDDAPYDFICHHTEKDLSRFKGFVHRTFQTDDLLYLIYFLQYHYRTSASLETAFSRWITPKEAHIENALIGFHNYVFSMPEVMERTRKHIATPTRKSTCKRLCLYLRWMVRKDTQGVDMGLWDQIKPAQLLMPLDIHVERQARQLNLIERKQTDWQTVLELTESMRQFDPSDPVKYDFALFGLGIESKIRIY